MSKQRFNTGAAFIMTNILIKFSTYVNKGVLFNLPFSYDEEPIENGIEYPTEILYILAMEPKNVSFSFLDIKRNSK